MLKTWFCAGVLSMGLALVGCDDGNHDNGDVGSSGDNLKGRDKDKTKDAQVAVADAKPATKADAAIKDEPKPDDASACAALLCPANTKCVVKQVQCVRAPCPPVASCEPIQAPATCAVTLCKQGTTCVEGPNGAQCVDQNTTPGCAAVLCAPDTICVEGANGPECVAQQKCTAKCSAGQHCELEDVVCVKAPCLPVPHCVVDDLCQTVKCTATTHCETVQPQCFTTPCPAHAECVPN